MELAGQAAVKPQYILESGAAIGLYGMDGEMDIHHASEVVDATGQFYAIFCNYEGTEARCIPASVGYALISTLSPPFQPSPSVSPSRQS